MVNPVVVITMLITSSMCVMQAAEPVKVDGTSIKLNNVPVEIEKDLQIDGTLQVGTGAVVNEISTDETFADNSDMAVPTEKAVKAYIDSVLPKKVATFNVTSETNTIVFAYLSGSYSYYELRFKNLTVATNGAGVELKVSDDNGATWISATDKFRYTRIGIDSNDVQYNTGVDDSDNGFWIVKTNMKYSSGGHGLSGSLKLHNIGSSVAPFKYDGGFVYKNDNNDTQTTRVGGILNSQENINAIRLKGSKNFDSGLVELWGIP